MARYGEYDAHGNPLWDARMDNQELREQERNWGLEDEEQQSERSRRADVEQAYQLAKRRRQLDYDSRLDFL